MATGTSSGLDGVVVAETQLSDVDGEKGRLILRGFLVEQLAGRFPFEALCGLFWDGELSIRRLGQARALAYEQLPALGAALDAADGMDALRASVAQLPRPSEEFVTGAMATFAAAWLRRRAGQSPIAPDPTLSHAADFLRMVHGQPASPAEVDALNAYWVTVVDHGMNASTFTARVVASTGSDLVSAVTGAIGALKGPLHGGAPGPVLDMLDAIGREDRAEAWVQSELNAGRRIMGMGHRIYRVRDPRAEVLERAIERLEASALPKDRLQLARAAEKAAEKILRERHPDRPLRANVEFYTAVLLEAIGLPRTAFSVAFALSRVGGWCAHVAEQRAAGRLIRPASRYIGPQPKAFSAEEAAALLKQMPAI